MFLNEKAEGMKKRSETAGTFCPIGKERSDRASSQLRKSAVGNSLDNPYGK